MYDRSQDSGARERRQLVKLIKFDIDLSSPKSMGGGGGVLRKPRITNAWRNITVGQKIEIFTFDPKLDKVLFVSWETHNCITKGDKLLTICEHDDDSMVTMMLAGSRYGSDDDTIVQWWLYDDDCAVTIS